ncbi:MAG: hypothetical protein Q7R70_06705 [Candidatus Diapherotrites archaeon]|nr:hypothetical protein [Candidatus Diapherotrites archaeon]
MKITVCSSCEFAQEAKKASGFLEAKGFEVFLPDTCEKIVSGKISKRQILEEKETGAISERVNSGNLTMLHFSKIKKSDAILVLNYSKKGIANYIGYSVFLEIGLAFGLEKKVFLLNPIPAVPYAEEIRLFHPIVLDGNLDLIK